MPNNAIVTEIARLKLLTIKRKIKSNHTTPQRFCPKYTPTLALALLNADSLRHIPKLIFVLVCVTKIGGTCDDDVKF